MGKRIGIDLGTTNSVSADAAGVQPRVLDSKENRPQMRSVVSLKQRRARGETGAEPEILTGDTAYDNWPMAPKDTILSVKRLMGRGFSDPQVQKVREKVMYEIVQPKGGTPDSVAVVLGGREYSPEEISAKILKKLKEDAEFRLTDKVTHAVITVPAYFSEKQKAATKRAGELAGLKVIDVLDEPTAAAIAYGMEFPEGGDPKYVVVYDLGGGTFDVSVLMWSGNVFAQLDLEGDMWLGGDNFDQLIVDHAVKQIRKEQEIDPVKQPRFMVELKRKAQEAKERLSASNSTTIIIPSLLKDADGDTVDVDLELTKQEFEAMAAPLVARTVALTETAVLNAKLTNSQVHYVLMAGNQTGMPLVQQAMEKLFGAEKVLRRIHPKQCVALGAARMAVLAHGVKCQAVDPATGLKCGHENEEDAQVCGRCGAVLAQQALPPPDENEPVYGGLAPFSYGVQLAGDKYSVFVKKNNRTPTPEADRQTRTFYTRLPNQRMVVVPVYGGEKLDKASTNEKQGEAIAVLPEGKPQDTPVLISVWLNRSKLFELTARLEDNTDLHPWIMRGEVDAKTVQLIDDIEQKIEALRDSLPPATMQDVEATRRQMYDRLTERDYGAAQQLIAKLNDTLRPPPPPTLLEQLKMMVNYARYVVNEYNWALDAEVAYRLNRLIEDSRQAVESQREDVVTQKIAELERELAYDRLGLAGVLISWHGHIRSVIAPIDPAMAGKLEEKLNGVEVMLRERRTDAQAALHNVIEEIKRATPTGDPEFLLQTCSACRAKWEKSRGYRCPKCGLDIRTLTDATSHVSSSGSIRT